LIEQCFPFGMGRLLDSLLESSSAYRVVREADGFMLIGDPDHLDEFSDLVREAAARSGEEFVVFAVSEGGHRYSEMFVMPLDWPLTSD